MAHLVFYKILSLLFFAHFFPYMVSLPFSIFSSCRYYARLSLPLLPYPLSNRTPMNKMLVFLRSVEGSLPYMFSFTFTNLLGGYVFSFSLQSDFCTWCAYLSCMMRHLAPPDSILNSSSVLPELFFPVYEQKDGHFLYDLVLLKAPSMP